MAGKVDRVDVDYFESEIKPQIDGKHIEYLGEANHFEINALLGGARAMLFPITWREPFGLVMTESMAAGTPVIAKPLGAVPEVIANGISGFFCDSVDDFVDADLQHIYLITSDFHMRRARVIATVVLGSRGDVVTPIAVHSKRPSETMFRALRDGGRTVVWLFTGKTGARIKGQI